MKLTDTDHESNMTRRELPQSDEGWLRGPGNPIDDGHAMYVFQNASGDYMQELDKLELDPKDRDILERIGEFAGSAEGDWTEPVGNSKQNLKRKDGPSSEKESNNFEGEPSSSSSKIPANGSKKASGQKVNATLAQRIEILDWHNANGKVQTKTAAHFNAIYPDLRVKQPLISSWLKDEARWRAEWESDHTSRFAKRQRQTQHPEITAMMDLWITKAIREDVPITSDLMRDKWTSFANLAGIPSYEKLKLSDGWLTRFKERHGLMQMKRRGKTAMTSVQTVDDERLRIQKIIIELGYTPQNIYGVEDSRLLYALPPDSGVAFQKPDIKASKVKLTYVLAVNADGSDRRPLFVIGKADRPSSLNQKSGTQLGFHYKNNPKVWLTTVSYREWLQAWDQELKTTGRKILLIQDNFAGHALPDDLENIHVMNLERKLAVHVQPINQDVIHSFKAHYRARFIEYALDRYDLGVHPYEIYNIDQLKAMQLTRAAWDDIDIATIRSSWWKAGILPPSFPLLSSVIPPAMSFHSSPNQMADGESENSAAAVKRLGKALNDLETAGVLNRLNQVPVAALLNPDEESLKIDMTNTTDEEIYRVVMDDRKAHEESAVAGNNGIDDNVLIEARPTRKEALQAVFVLQRYLRELNDPFAQKLDAMLGLFGQRTRMLEPQATILPAATLDAQASKPTKSQAKASSAARLTDYFPRK